MNTQALAADITAIFKGNRPDGLLHLSVNTDGTVPTNDERARLLRTRLPSPTHNTFQWHTLPASPSAANIPVVAGGLELDYASEQSPQDPIRSYADRRGF
jgi:hypothetical protein